MPYSISLEFGLEKVYMSESYNVWEGRRVNLINILIMKCTRVPLYTMCNLQCVRGPMCLHISRYVGNRKNMACTSSDY